MVNKDRLVLFLRFGVSFGLLFTLFWIMRNDIGSIISTLKKSNKIFFIAALSISIPLAVGMSFRLKLLMSGQKIFLPMKDFIYLTFIGYFFNNFFPTAIGGDFAKAYYASKKTNNRAASYAAVLADRLMGFLSCLSIAVIGVIFFGKGFQNKKIIWTVITMLVLLISAIVFLLNKKRASFLVESVTKKGALNKIKGNIAKLYNAVNSYRHNTALLIRAYLLAVFMQGCAVMSVYFFILCVGGDIYILKLFLIIPLVWAVSMLPSLNGLGVREGAFVYFLKGDIGRDQAFSVSILWLGVIILYSVIGGVMHLLYPIKTRGVSEVR